MRPEGSPNHRGTAPERVAHDGSAGERGNHDRESGGENRASDRTQRRQAEQGGVHRRSQRQKHAAAGEIHAMFGHRLASIEDNQLAGR